ncbi:MAG: ISAs1 family transposase [Pseudomonadota bacterium]
MQKLKSGLKKKSQQEKNLLGPGIKAPPKNHPSPTFEYSSTRYYVLSKQMMPDEFLSTVRSHWTIENSLHWVLDVTMREDKSRSRKDHTPENIAMIRKLALNILRAHPEKTSIRRKIKKAGWSNIFLKSLLFNMRWPCPFEGTIKLPM